MSAPFPSTIGFQSNAVLTYYPGFTIAHAFSTIGPNSYTQYNKVDTGTGAGDFVNMGINFVNQISPNPPAKTLSIRNELTFWDTFAVGSLGVCGNVAEGTETTQFIGVSTGQLYMTGNLQVSSINGTSVPSSLFIAQYYKSADQTLTNGNTDITFDLTQPWNNTGGYITHTDGTTDFTVVQPGLYQLEFNCGVSANGAVYNLADIGKSAGIDITRIGIAEQFVILNTALQASGANYGQSVNGTFNLEVGDIINLRIVNTYTGGPPAARGVSNTFDLNTFFTWTYLS
jgi:hypothetical protein